MSPAPMRVIVSVMHQVSLFDSGAETVPAGRPVPLTAAGAWHLPGRAGSVAQALLDAVRDVAAAAPYRRYQTPGGRTMAVEMTNCGPHGWVSDRHGYRYVTEDPLDGQPWPAMPMAIRELAEAAAREAGFPGFAADACLINRYAPGTRLSLHQDRDERDRGHPIVSVSLGLPATFLFGGASRSATVQRVPLLHGDVVVWGGPSRLHYHGVAPVADGWHPMTGAWRINLTLRRAA